MVKKAKEHYKGRKPEFVVMSRRPGIGKRFIEKFMSDVFPSDEVIVRGVKCRPPRYYSGVAESRGVDLTAVKARREEAADHLEEVRLKGGFVVEVAPSRNARRLEVREKVARAKAALKTKKL